MRYTGFDIYSVRGFVAGVGALLVGAVCGCGAEPPPGPKLEVTLFGWAAYGQSAGEFVGELEDYPGASDVNVQLTQPDRGEVVSDPTSADLESGELELPEMAFGDGLRLDFDLIDTTQTPAIRVGFGATPTFDSNPDAEDREYQVQITETEEFAPVGARFASNDTERGWSYQEVQFDDRAVDEKFLGRTGHRAVRTESGDALIVGGAAVQAAAPDAVPEIQVLHDDIQRFEPGSGYITDLSFDESEGRRRPEDAGRLAIGRAFHTVTPIGDDRYLVAGGFTGKGAEMQPTGAIEIVDLKADAGARVSQLRTEGGTSLSLNVARGFHTASYRESDHEVVIAGGIDASGEILKSVEVIDLEGLRVSESSELTVPRAKHEALVMGDAEESVWILGGLTEEEPGVLSTTELLVSQGEGISAQEAGSFPGPRYEMAAARTAAKIAVVCGGYTAVGDNGAPTKRCQLGNMDRDQWGDGWELSWARGGADIVAMTQSKDMVVLGGRDENGETVRTAAHLSFEGPNANPPYVARDAGQTSEERYDPTVTYLSNGYVLLTGGIGSSDGGRAPLATFEYYNPADVVRATAPAESEDTSEQSESSSSE